MYVRPSFNRLEVKEDPPYCILAVLRFILMLGKPGLILSFFE